MEEIRSSGSSCLIGAISLKIDRQIESSLSVRFDERGEILKLDLHFNTGSPFGNYTKEAAALQGHGFRMQEYLYKQLVEFLQSVYAEQ